MVCRSLCTVQGTVSVGTALSVCTCFCTVLRVCTVVLFAVRSVCPVVCTEPCVCTAWFVLRCALVQELPRFLNLQLLRFVFDIKSGNRKKVFFFSFSLLSCSFLLLLLSFFLFPRIFVLFPFFFFFSFSSLLFLSVTGDRCYGATCLLWYECY